MDNSPRLPGFAMTLVIVDLVLCAVRIPIVALAALAVAQGMDLGAMQQSAPFEVVSGIGIVVFGILGNVLVLAKKPLGVSLGWINVGFLCLSLLTAVWQASIQVNSFADSAQKMGAAVGAGTVVLIRVVLGGLYCAALVQARKALAPASNAEVL